MVSATVYNSLEEFASYGRSILPVVDGSRDSCVCLDLLDRERETEEIADRMLEYMADLTMMLVQNMEVAGTQPTMIATQHSTTL